MGWFDGVTLIIICVMVTCAFLLGLWEGENDADENLDYLAAEVENLNDALDALNDSYQREILSGEQVFKALQNSMAERERMERFFMGDESPMSPETRRALRDAWREVNGGR
jgi:hypothetical protein